MGGADVGILPERDDRRHRGRRAGADRRGLAGHGRRPGRAPAGHRARRSPWSGSSWWGWCPTGHVAPPRHGLAQFRPEPAAVLLIPAITGLDDFQTIATRVSLLQALWLVSLAATGLLLLGAVRRRAIAFAVLPAVLGVAVALPLLPVGGSTRCGRRRPGRHRAGLRQRRPAGLRDAGARRAAARRRRPRPPGARHDGGEAAQRTGPGGGDPTGHLLGAAGPGPGAGPGTPPTRSSSTPPRSTGSGAPTCPDDYFLPSLLEAAWQQECGDQSVGATCTGPGWSPPPG